MCKLEFGLEEFADVQDGGSSRPSTDKRHSLNCKESLSMQIYSRRDSDLPCHSDLSHETAIFEDASKNKLIHRSPDVADIYCSVSLHGERVRSGPSGDGKTSGEATLGKVNDPSVTIGGREGKGSRPDRRGSLQEERSRDVSGRAGGSISSQTATVCLYRSFSLRR